MIVSYNVSFVVVVKLCSFGLQLCAEYELDKRQAMDRISTELEHSTVKMRNCIERAYERERDELIRRLEVEQKERLAAVKRRQWVGIALLIYTCAVTFVLLLLLL